MFHQFCVTLTGAVFLATAAQATCTAPDRFTTTMSESTRAELAARAHAAPYASGLIYRATKGDQVVTIVGTYHLPDPRHEGLVDAVAPALGSATALLVEAGPEEEARLQQAMLSDPAMMFVLSGPTLPEILPEADWQAVAREAGVRGVPAVVAAKMKPGFLAMTLAIPPCAMAAMAQGAGGLDKKLMAFAADENVPVHALEPWNTAIGLFDELEKEDAVSMLRSTVAEASNGDKNAVTMANLYFAGEPRVIWELAAEWSREAGMPEAEVRRQMDLGEDLLIVKRNRAWIPVIEQHAATGPIVVAVGAMHLSGDEGVLRLLEADGYRIDRLDRTE